MESIVREFVIKFDLPAGSVRTVLMKWYKGGEDLQNGEDRYEEE